MPILKRSCAGCHEPGKKKGKLDVTSFAALSAGGKTGKAFIAGEPDKSLVALFRDNGGSSRLFRSFSTDNGQTWSQPTLTNYPNSSSKLFSFRTSAGLRLLISNANPGLGRRELHVALSEDGLVFTKMARLDIPSPKRACTVKRTRLSRFQQPLKAVSKRMTRYHPLGCCTVCGAFPCVELSSTPWSGVTPTTTNRVGGTHCCVPPPSELGGRAFPAPSSSKPRRAHGWAEVLALAAFAVDSRRRQWACTRRFW